MFQKCSGGVLADAGPGAPRSEWISSAGIPSSQDSTANETESHFFALLRPVSARSELPLEPDHRSAHVGGDRSAVEIAFKHQMPIPGDRGPRVVETVASCHIGLPCQVRRVAKTEAADIRTGDTEPVLIECLMTRADSTASAQLPSSDKLRGMAPDTTVSNLAS